MRLASHQERAEGIISDVKNEIEKLNKEYGGKCSITYLSRGVITENIKILKKILKENFDLMFYPDCSISTWLW